LLCINAEKIQAQLGCSQPSQQGTTFFTVSSFLRSWLLLPETNLLEEKRRATFFDTCGNFEFFMEATDALTTQLQSATFCSLVQQTADCPITRSITIKNWPRAHAQYTHTTSRTTWIGNDALTCKFFSSVEFCKTEQFSHFENLLKL